MITKVGSDGVEAPSPQNDVKGNIYTLKFKITDKIPSAGYIKVDFPKEEVVLNPSTTLSTGSCKEYTCLDDASPTTIKFLIAGGEKAAGEEITLKIGGATNPRSFKPTQPIMVTSLDTDGVSQIDVGYNTQAVMTIPGEVTSFSITQDKFVNGIVNEYSFAV